MAAKRVNRSKPYGRVTWRGAQFDNRTVSALKWVERKWSARAGKGRKLIIAQGSYNRGGVAVSGGTHDGGGAVDISTTGMSRRQVRRLVRWMRRGGWAAWYRKPIPGTWGPHIHAILLGHRTASVGAKQQMQAYLAHRDGLAGNRYDPAWRPKPIPRWSHKRNRPV